MTAPQTPTPAPVVEVSHVVQWLSQLRTDVAESVGGVLLRGARPVQVGTAAGGTARPSTGPGCVVGYSLRAGAAGASVDLVDGDNGDGDLVAVVDLAADQAVTQWFGPGGVNLARGLFVDVTAGDVEGAVYLRGPE